MKNDLIKSLNPILMLQKNEKSIVGQFSIDDLVTKAIREANKFILKKDSYGRTHKK